MLNGAMRPYRNHVDRVQATLVILLVLLGVYPAYAVNVVDPAYPPGLGTSHQSLTGNNKSTADQSSSAVIQPEAVDHSQATVAGGILNYDLQYRQQASEMAGSGQIKLGVFNHWGVATTTFRAQGLDGRDRLTRQNTTWRYDWAQTDKSLVVGDSVSRTGAWGRRVHFGGLQWGSDFAGQTDFLSLPWPAFENDGVIPTSIQRYADTMSAGADRQSQMPFSVHGGMPMANSDPLQRMKQAVLSRTAGTGELFNPNGGLLQNGLHDYTYQAGFLREHPLLESNDYGHAFVSGTHRLGLTDWLTGEARAEVLHTQQTFGLNGVMASVPWLDRVSGSIVGSHAAAAGIGALTNIGVSHQTGRFDYEFRYTAATGDFRQVGLSAEEPVPGHRLLAGFGMQLLDDSSLSLSYVDVDRRVGRNSRFINANYQRNLYQGINLNTFVSPDLQHNDTLIGVVVTMAFGAQKVPASDVRPAEADDIYHHRFGPYNARLTARGYRRRLSSEGERQYLNRTPPEVVASTRHGRYHARVEPLGDQMAQQVHISGSAAMVNGDFYFAH